MRQELTNSFKEVEDWAAANKLQLGEAKSKSALVLGGGTPYIRMIGMIVVFFRGCNRRFGIF